VLTIRQKDL